ncbi:MAG: radical SAM protein [Chitinophagaceae bacterium]
MYSVQQYLERGISFLRNNLFPTKKQLSTLMLYGTDLCDSACKHCLIWTKRPVNYLPFEKIVEVMQSKCVTKKTTVGLEGGEFLLHPQAFEILKWFKEHHPNFDLLSNALQPDKVIKAAELYPPKRLFISLDGPKDTYNSMRGKDGYEGIIQVFEKLHKKLPISAMFTLSPYNDFDDLEHVAQVCKRFDIDLRIGVYNNIAFFDTIDKAHFNSIGTLKNNDALNFKQAKSKQNYTSAVDVMEPSIESISLKIKEHIPSIVKDFPENYDFLVLYDQWRRGDLKLNCYSILDSLVILPNGDVPICQHLNLLIGNVFTNTLDEVFNGPEAIAQQKDHVKNCNACWINFHRKYDVILYRNFERFFGTHVTSKMLGYYWWEGERKKTYKQLINE